jgi:hypothetical protein
MNSSTHYLARLIGIFVIVVEAAVLVRPNEIIDAMVGDHSAIVVMAMISLAAGIAMVLAHNIWSGGVLPVVVTLVGWLMLAKGILLLLLAPAILDRLFEQMHDGEHIYLYLAPSFLFGLYLTWAGFAAPAPPGAPRRR